MHYSIIMIKSFPVTQFIHLFVILKLPSHFHSGFLLVLIIININFLIVNLFLYLINLRFQIFIIEFIHYLQTCVPF